MKKLKEQNEEVRDLERKKMQRGRESQNTMAAKTRTREKIKDKQWENEREIEAIRMEIRASPFYHPILSSSKIHV